MGVKQALIVMLAGITVVTTFLFTGCKRNSSSATSSLKVKSSSNEEKTTKKKEYESDKFIKIPWPDSELAKMIPVTKSNIGKIVSDTDIDLTVYIGNTTKEQYNSYVEECQEMGFNRNHNIGEQFGYLFYDAYNKDNYNLYIKYHEMDDLSEQWPDKQTMIIELYAPNEEEKAEDYSEETTEEVTEAATEKEEIFPVENAKRAAIVALTNGTVSDVFADDGFSIDKSKLHSYSDLSGEYILVDDWGSWKEKNSNTWHVDNLTGTNSYNNKVIASLDVTFSSNVYTVSNITGSYGNNDLKEIEETVSTKNDIVNVSPNLIKDNRDTSALQEDKAEQIDHYYAKKAFEKYGEAQYPNGFKCHWILDLYNDEQDNNGTYFFKVGVTVKNSSNAKQEMIAEGKVSGTNDSPVVKDFIVY